MLTSILHPLLTPRRVAPSFVRFGTFQLPASRGGAETPLVQATADYIIKHHFPHLQGVTNGAECSVSSVWLDQLVTCAYSEKASQEH